MLTRRSFLASLSAFVGTLATWRPAWSQTTLATRVTFLLTNDIYLMGDQPFPDGKRRGGFARLAAVVKAERAKGGHVIFAHGGDTLSPSLMSGFDRGAHIIALTNMIRPDIFVAGNHEFDFGKQTFLQRMAEAVFPLFGANLRGPDGAPLPATKDRAIVDFAGVRIGLTGLVFDRSDRVSSPEDLQFRPTIDIAREQAEALRQEGADFVVAVMHAERGDSLALQMGRAADLILTGHTHDLFVNFDGQSAIVESGYDGHYVTAIDIDIRVQESGGRRATVWWPQFRIIDTADVAPDPEVAAQVARYEADFAREMDVVIGTTAVELDSRNATVRTREAAIGNLFADAMRLSTRSDAALINGGGIRAGKVYPAGAAITRRDIMAELPFNNRVVVVQLSGADLWRALENGLTQLPLASGRFPQVSGLQVDYAPARAPGARVTAMQVDGAPLDPARLYRVAILDFLANGGDDYTMLRDAQRITPDNDAPLLATEVMSHIERLGAVRTVVEGRLRAR
ncbi:MAG: bifunctional metallophosphatase/5'-nucleotidase [Variibacter sp.]|nr:bifunctional metallophosphatase/5'-nucleotidase [Variibacter sp.]